MIFLKTCEYVGSYERKKLNVKYEKNNSLSGISLRPYIGT